MDKYYTPNTEEFHIGFEYEERYPDSSNKEWNKVVLSTKEVFPPYDEYNSEFRVKYLDQEDVKELGFESSHDEPDEWFHSYKGNGEIQLYFDDKKRNEDQGVGVTMYGETDASPIFNGYVKNKSELKRLIKQLGL